MSEKSKNTQSLSVQQLKKLKETLLSSQQTLKNSFSVSNQSVVNSKPGFVKRSFVSFLNFLYRRVGVVDSFINLVINNKKDPKEHVVTSARGPILFGFFVITFFVVFGLLWAATAPLDSASVAIGTLISSSQKKVINYQDTGVIKALYVKVGDNVKVGDKLIDFDDIRLRSEYENNLNQYRSYLAHENRLIAEINNDKEIKYSDFLLADKGIKEVARLLETQNNLLKSRRDLFLAEQNSLKQRIKQSYKAIEAYKARDAALAKTLEVTRDRLNAHKELNKEGFTQKSMLLEFEMKESNTLGEIAINNTEIAKTEQEITKIEIDLINISSKMTSNILSELKEVQLHLVDRKEKFLFYKDALTKTLITSPVDGIVNSLNYHTVGSTVHSGQQIMEISPTNDSLIIEAKLDPKLIDSITVGLESKIRFSAFKSRTTPLFKGKVVSLAPDVFIDPRGERDPRLAHGYYLVKIELDMKEFDLIAKPRKLRLYPGMQAEVQIITGTRTLLRYLLDPVIDAIFKGLKEK